MMRWGRGMTGCSQSRLETGEWMEYGAMLRTEKRELYWAKRHSRGRRNFRVASEGSLLTEWQQQRLACVPVLILHDSNVVCVQ